MKDNSILLNILYSLLANNAENEIVEFKEAKNDFDFSKLGKYFSALSNEANLKNKDYAWIVFGVEDKNHSIVGSNYRNNTSLSLDNLKKEIADKSSNRVTFKEIYEIFLDGKRIVMFQISPAPLGLPISFDGHFYGRDGESLVALNIEKIERIRNQNSQYDWTAEIVNDATIDDLDPIAIKKARIEFIKRNPNRTKEERDWDDAKFLDKAKLTIKGKITRTALILLGLEESEHFIGSAVKIRWILRSLNNQNKGSEIFSIPFILNIDKVFSRIRNLNYIYTKDDTIFPEEMPRYDVFTIREPLNNAIAHQDYSKKGYINVIEYEDDHLIFSNLGSFLPASVEDVVLQDTPQENYRNPFLVAAMKNVNMIETEGGGIRKIFNLQRLRLFPMPEYEINVEQVKMTIFGKILNMDFARILIKNPNLSLVDIILLDKVQKQNIDLNDEQLLYLKKRGYVEGRKNSIFLSKNVIESTQDQVLQAEYIRNRGFDKKYYKDMIVEYIKKWQKASKKEIYNLLISKLPETMSLESRKNKVMHLLQELRRDGIIENSDDRKWRIKK